MSLSRKYIGDRAKSIYLFDRKLILNIAMLLRDSLVAKSIRKCLLNMMDTNEGKELFNKTIDEMKGGFKYAFNYLNDNEKEIMTTLLNTRDEITRSIVYIKAELETIKENQNIINENIDITR